MPTYLSSYPYHIPAPAGFSKWKWRLLLADGWKMQISSISIRKSGWVGNAVGEMGNGKWGNGDWGLGIRDLDQGLSESIKEKWQ